MLKRLLVAVIILLSGFVINAFVYGRTLTSGSNTQDVQDVCIKNGPETPAEDPTTGPPLNPVDVGVSAGEPLNTNSSVKLPPAQGCGESNSQPTFHLSDFIGDWQFYANWLVWSAPLFGIAYVISGRYANSRH